MSALCQLVLLAGHRINYMFVAFNTYNVSETYSPIRAILVLIGLSSNADRVRRLARTFPARLHNVWMYMMFQTKTYTYRAVVDSSACARLLLTDLYVFFVKYDFAIFPWSCRPRKACACSSLKLVSSFHITVAFEV